MKLTKSTLKQLIKEELRKVLNEQTVKNTTGYIEGSSVQYLGHQIKKAGKQAKDYDFFKTALGTVFAQFKGTYKGNAKPIKRPTASQLNYSPFGPRDTYHKD